MITTDESVLRTPCINASREEAEEIIAQLEKELIESARNGQPGIGLAAPQIGIHKKVAIIRVGSNKIDLVNPIILNFYDEFTFKDEGCLSFPDKKVYTKRFNEIEVQNDFGNFIATGLTAVAVQHETDHLNNVLLTDRQLKPKLRPNDLCFCKSGKKYKKCCG